MFFWYKWTALVCFLSFNYHSQHSLSACVCTLEGVRQDVHYHTIGQVCVYFPNCLSLYVIFFLLLPFYFLFDDAKFQASVFCLISPYIRLCSELFIGIAGVTCSVLVSTSDWPKLRSFLLPPSIRQTQTLQWPDNGFCKTTHNINEACCFPIRKRGSWWSLSPSVNLSPPPHLLFHFFFPSESHKSKLFFPVFVNSAGVTGFYLWRGCSRWE